MDKHHLKEHGAFFPPTFILQPENIFAEMMNTEKDIRGFDVCWWSSPLSGMESQQKEIVTGMRYWRHLLSLGADGFEMAAVNTGGGCVNVVQGRTTEQVWERRKEEEGQGYWRKD